MRPAVLVAVCSALACVTISVTPAPACGQTGDPYAEALATYSSGNASDAIAILDQLSEADIRDAVSKRWRRPVFTQAGWARELRIAMLAHTETWLVRGVLVPTSAFDPHIESGRFLARTLLRAIDAGESGAGPAERRFVRDWYLLVVSAMHGQMQVGRSRVYIAEAKKLFPRDAELLLLEGAGHEMLSGLTVATVQLYDSMGRPTSSEDIDEARELRLAAAAIGEAVTAHPELTEARLRLGRILYRRGDLAGAVRELEAIKAATKVAQLKYLANVFLGLVYSSRGELARAAEVYREAIAVNPDGQVAIVGLSEVEYLSGRVKEASRLMTDVLNRVLKDDPWWAYQMGGWWTVETRFVRLRATVLP
jgi:tetratricopeptide (TPR) repeat protein